MCRGHDQLPFGVVVTVDEELGHVRTCRGLPRPKPTDLCICMNDVDHDYAIYRYHLKALCHAIRADYLLMSPQTGRGGQLISRLSYLNLPAEALSAASSTFQASYVLYSPYCRIWLMSACTYNSKWKGNMHLINDMRLYM